MSWSLRVPSVIALLAALGGCSGDDPIVEEDTAASVVTRGRYLVNNVAQCAFCHTPLLPDGTRDSARLFAGDPCLVDVVPEDPSVGCLPSRNLTPHATGLRNRSDAEIKAMLRDGVRPDGKAMAGVMPYWVFHNMTDGDLDAIVAYLRTLTPVENMIPARQPPWDGLPAPTPPLDPAGIPAPPDDHPQRERAMHGRYLATMAGLCVDCHTPDLPPNDPQAFLIVDRTRLFQGNRVFPSFALGLPSPPYPPVVLTANLTPDRDTGIGRYTVADLVRLMRTGKDLEGKYLCAATHGGPTSPYAALEDGDVEDIAIYLLSLAPVASPVAGTCEGIQ